MPTTKQHLTQLESTGLLRLAQTQPELEYLFRHALVQDAAYESLLLADRKKLHRQIGETLERLYPDRLDGLAATLAHHYIQAGDEKKAAAYLIRAGDYAQRITAIIEAVQFYEAALKRLPESNKVERAETLSKLGTCQKVIFHQYEAIESFMAGEILFEALGDKKRAAAMEREIGEVNWEVGNKAKSLEHCYKALTILEQGPESIELAWALSSVSHMHMVSSEYEQAIDTGERALELAGRLQAEEVTVHALNNVGMSYVGSGNAERGVAMLQDSLSRALALGLPHDTLRAYHNLGEALATVGRYNEAWNAFNSQQAYGEDINSLGWFGSATVLLTRLEWLLGEWDAALIRCRDQFDRFHNPRIFTHIPGIWASSLLGRIYNDLGQAEVARQELESMLSSARRADEVQTTLPHLTQLVRAYAALGMELEAEDIGNECFNWIRRNIGGDTGAEGTLPLLVICQWFCSYSNPEKLNAAFFCLQRLELAHKQLGTLETETYFNEGRGSIALAEGNNAEAVEPFQHATACWANLKRPYDQARALKYLGQTLAQASNVTDARDAFNQANGIIEMLAAQLDEAELKTSFLNSPLVKEIQAGLGVSE